MDLFPTPLPGVFEVASRAVTDERGFFVRTYCQATLAAQGVDMSVAQGATSFNARRGTLRGLHFQRAPHAETKLVRCVRGAVFDVAVDLRPDSPTHRRWHAVTLTADNHRQMLIPPGVAHGFLTLEDATELGYLITPAYQPDFVDGARWDDPAFAIAWPFAPLLMSPRDFAFPDYERADIRRHA